MGFRPTSGPGARAGRRPRRHPHQPRGGRRPVRRRGPPHAAHGRGGAVSGARGLQARRRDRQGAERAEHPPRPAAVHAGRGDDAPGADHAAAAAAVRLHGPPRLLRRRGPGARGDALGAASSTCRWSPTAPTRSPAARAGRRGSRTACFAASATSRRCAPTAGSPARARPTRLALFEVDERGLDKVDLAILTTIVEKFRGGPVGLSTLAAAVGEESDTIEDVYEPYLMQLGFLKRTPARAGGHARRLPAPGRTAPGDAPAAVLVIAAGCPDSGWLRSVVASAPLRRGPGAGSPRSGP